MDTVQLVFLKADKKVFEKNKETVLEFAKKKEVWVADMADFDAFHMAVFNTKSTYNIINLGLAVKTMSLLAKEYIKEHSQDVEDEKQ